MLALSGNLKGNCKMLFDLTQKTRFITEISKDDQWKESNIYCKNFTRVFQNRYLKDIGTVLYRDCWNLNVFHEFNFNGKFLKNGSLTGVQFFSSLHSEKREKRESG